MERDYRPATPMRSFLQKRFFSINESYPDEQWLQHYGSTKDRYKTWLLQEGDARQPSLAACHAALHTHMPELVPLWQHLLELTHATDWEARLLSMYCPAPYTGGCSQSVWTRYSPILVRNYDHKPALCEGRIMKSRWHEAEVIAMTEHFWGAVDGMNSYGLAVSFAVGGSRVVGEGFGMALVLRYILEFCRTTEEAIAVLRRVPVHMAYNVTLLDRRHRCVTVEIGPGATPRVLQLPLAVNHQGDFSLRNFSSSSCSLERKQALLDQLYNPSSSIDSFIHAFEYAPLFATDYEEGRGTLYTAIYNPTMLSVEYRWPYQRRMYLSFERFSEQEIRVIY